MSVAIVVQFEVFLEYIGIKIFCIWYIRVSRWAAGSSTMTMFDRITLLHDFVTQSRDEGQPSCNSTPRVPRKSFFKRSSRQ